MSLELARPLFSRPVKNRRRARSLRGRWAGPDGFTTLELLAVLGLMAVIMAVSLPALQRLYLRSQVSSTVTTIETMFLRARMSALKEKIAYRVLIHDENAATPNTLELQRNDGGSFVTLAGEVQTLPRAVRILGSGPTDSLDSMTVNSRGECTSGNVYATIDGADIGVVAIASTCFTTAG